MKKKADFSRDKRWRDGETETKTEVRDSWQCFLSPWIQQLETADNSGFHMNWVPQPLQTFATLDWNFVTYHQTSAINTLILLACKCHFHKVKTWHSNIIVNPCQRFTKLINKEGSRVGGWIRGSMQDKSLYRYWKKECWNFFFFFDCSVWHAGSWFSDQGLNTCPLRWKCRVPTSEPPKKSPRFHFRKTSQVLAGKLLEMGRWWSRRRTKWQEGLVLVKSLQLNPRPETLCELLDTAMPEARKSS